MKCQQSISVIVELNEQIMYAPRSGVIPSMMGVANGDADKRWEQLQQAIYFYLDNLEDPTTVVKSEFELWLKKWEGVGGSGG